MKYSSLFVAALVFVWPALSGRAQQTSSIDSSTTTSSLQQQSGQPNGQLVANQIVEPTQPKGFPLPNDHQEYVEALLDAWEQSSSQIKRCVVDFQRVDYDPSICNWREPNTNKLAGSTIVQGEIRYQSPGKASYEATKAWDFAGPPKEDGADPEYKFREDADISHEKWICDGSATYEFDFVNKRLYESTIPQEHQGNGLINSPMPFLFGANKKQILERYWVKVITPKGVEDEYWLEAYPKKIDDAQNYQKVQIVITRQAFLPRSIHVFAPNYDEVKNPVSRHFDFGNRRINDQLSAFTSFLNLFIRPQTPINWSRVDRNVPTTENASANSSDDPARRGLQNGSGLIK